MTLTDRHMTLPEPDICHLAMIDQKSREPAAADIDFQYKFEWKWTWCAGISPFRDILCFSWNYLVKLLFLDDTKT